jgi:cell division protein FtsI (penicillin-binding protein 3)
MSDFHFFDSYEHKAKQNTAMVKSRLFFVLSCLLFLFLIVALKSTEVTIFSSKKKVTEQVTKLKSSRADIIDRNGVIVATTLKTASAYANASEMKNIEEAVLKLSEVLPSIDNGKLLSDLEKGGKFVWVKRNITPKEQQQINNLGIPGIYFTSDVARVYPHGNLMSHMLGYVDIDNNGLAGIERQFDENLALDEEALKLSIDVKLQNILHDELSTQVKDFRAAGAVGMITDVNTGEVLALVSLPDFDPNFANKALPDQKFNRTTLGTYEMGSTFKPFTAAMALEFGVSDLNKKYDTTPIYQDGFTINDYHSSKRPMSLTEIIMHSSNTGTARVAMGVTAEQHQEFLERIGMFGKPQIELPEKSKTLKPKKWGDLSRMTISFGHGIAVTPVNLVTAFMPIVNGGYYLPLSVLKHKKTDVISKKQVIKKSTSDDMLAILRMTVIAGTGRKADAKGYLVGGKTGTAEKLEGGRYSKTDVMSSFLSVFPTNKPKYVVVAIIDSPHEKIPGVRPTGGQVAAPVVHNVVMRTGTLLGIRPQKDVPINLNDNDNSDQTEGTASNEPATNPT